MLRNVSLGLVLALAACGSARSIQRTPTGGIIELQGDQNKAMEDANAQMAAHCGGAQNVQITLQGEEPVGTDTVQQQQTTDTEHTSKSGRTTTDQQTTTNTTSTRTAMVWRVHYTCGAPGTVPAAAPGGAPPAAPPPAEPPPPPAPGGY